NFDHGQLIVRLRIDRHDYSDDITALRLPGGTVRQCSIDQRGHGRGVGRGKLGRSETGGHWSTNEIPDGVLNVPEIIRALVVQDVIDIVPRSRTGIATGRLTCRKLVGQIDVAT